MKKLGLSMQCQMTRAEIQYRSDVIEIKIARKAMLQIDSSCFYLCSMCFDGHSLSLLFITTFSSISADVVRDWWEIL